MTSSHRRRKWDTKLTILGGFKELTWVTSLHVNFSSSLVLLTCCFYWVGKNLKIQCVFFEECHWIWRHIWKSLKEANIYFYRWYFDTKQHKCLKFVYSGCLGNANNFESENECNENCFSWGDDYLIPPPRIRGWYLLSENFQVVSI